MLFASGKDGIRGQRKFATGASMPPFGMYAIKQVGTVSAFLTVVFSL